MEEGAPDIEGGAEDAADVPETGEATKTEPKAGE
jgi:hypothetical protein